MHRYISERVKIKMDMKVYTTKKIQKQLSILRISPKHVYTIYHWHPVLPYQRISPIVNKPKLISRKNARTTDYNIEIEIYNYKISILVKKNLTLAITNKACHIYM